MNSIERRTTMFNRVLIVDNAGMMGAGLEKLLAKETSLEVFGISTASETSLIQAVWRLKPDIIILILENWGINPLRLMDLLKHYGSLRIIQVSVNNNILEVYEKQQIAVRDKASLFVQIKKNSCSEKMIAIIENQDPIIELILRN